MNSSRAKPLYEQWEEMRAAANGRKLDAPMCAAVARKLMTEGFKISDGLVMYWFVRAMQRMNNDERPEDAGKAAWIDVFGRAPTATQKRILTAQKLATESAYDPDAGNALISLQQLAQDEDIGTLVGWSHKPHQLLLFTGKLVLMYVGNAEEIRGRQYATTDELVERYKDSQLEKHGPMLDGRCTDEEMACLLSYANFMRIALLFAKGVERCMDMCSRATLGTINVRGGGRSLETERRQKIHEVESGMLFVLVLLHCVSAYWIYWICRCGSEEVHQTKPASDTT
jgi:hypothetical protein